MSKLAEANSVAQGGIMSYWRKRCGKKGLRATDCVSDDTSASVNREKGAWIREYIGTEMAEEEGFEPSSPGAPVKRFSRPPHSTTLPPLRRGDAPPKGAPYQSEPGRGSRDKSGGEMGIRTPDTLLGHTRFPIVLLRPARTSLRIASASRT